jgi:hypothetical protein
MKQQFEMVAVTQHLLRDINGFGADLSKRVESGKPNPLIMPSFASQTALR